MIIANRVRTLNGRVFLTPRGSVKCRGRADAPNGNDLGAIAFVGREAGPGYGLLCVDVGIVDATTVGMVVYLYGEDSAGNPRLASAAFTPVDGVNVLGALAGLGADFEVTGCAMATIGAGNALGFPGARTHLVQPADEPVVVLSVRIIGDGTVGLEHGYSFVWTGYPPPTSLSVEWRIDGETVSTAATYAPVDDAAVLTCSVTASNGVGPPSSLAASILTRARAPTADLIVLTVGTPDTPVLTIPTWEPA